MNEKPYGTVTSINESLVLLRIYMHKLKEI